MELPELWPCSCCAGDGARLAQPPATLESLLLIALKPPPITDSLILQWDRIHSWRDWGGEEPRGPAALCLKGTALVYPISECHPTNPEEFPLGAGTFPSSARAPPSPVAGL